MGAGLYSFLLWRKFVTDMLSLFKDLPVIERVTNNIIVPQIEGNIATLKSAVHDSIVKGREKERVE